MITSPDTPFVGLKRKKDEPVIPLEPPAKYITVPVAPLY